MTSTARSVSRAPAVQEFDALWVDFEHHEPLRQLLARQQAAEQADGKRDRIVVAEQCNAPALQRARSIEQGDPPHRGFGSARRLVERNVRRGAARDAPRWRGRPVRVRVTGEAAASGEFRSIRRPQSERLANPCSPSAVKASPCWRIRMPRFSSSRRMAVATGIGRRASRAASASRPDSSCDAPPAATLPLRGALAERGSPPPLPADFTEGFLVDDSSSRPVVPPRPCAGMADRLHALAVGVLSLRTRSYITVWGELGLTDADDASSRRCVSLRGIDRGW